jgi:lysyl-tRNA synthetase class 2
VTGPWRTTRPPTSRKATGLAAAEGGAPGQARALRDAGTNPYPYRFDRSTTLGELRAAHGDLAPGTETEARVAIACRLLLIRRQGKLTFATMRDRTGEVQLFVSRAVLGDERHQAFDALDLGDWVGVDGTVMTTRKGELSVKVERFELLAKAVRPLPDKWKGLTDPTPLPPALHRPHRQRGGPPVFEVRHAVVGSFQARCPATASSGRAPSSPRGGGARPALRHPPQHARPRPAPAPRWSST